MLRLPDRWVWDHWLVDTGDEYHIFYLQAPRSLGDPELRHAHATVGHAVSTDLERWTVLPDALGAGPAGAPDDRATWTGSIVRDGDGWRMLYTGSRLAEQGLIQRIGSATSPDLHTWRRDAVAGWLEADPRWYEKLDLAAWHDEAWRDPWVFADPGGDGWHMLITARARAGAPADARGVVGHAWSPDLRRWEARPPLSAPGEFGHLEVTQVACVDGQWVLVFCTGPGQIAHARRDRMGREPASTFVCPADGPLGPYHVDRARPVSELYAGRLVQRRDGSWALMGFLGWDRDGTFQGAIPAPVPVAELAAFPGGGR